MITATDIEARRIRSVRLLAPLASDLAAWRLASGRPPAGGLVFPNHAGAVWGRDVARCCFTRAAP
jgi:hypothetical protein